MSSCSYPITANLLGFYHGERSLRPQAQAETKLLLARENPDTHTLHRVNMQVIPLTDDMMASGRSCRCSDRAGSLSGNEGLVLIAKVDGPPAPSLRRTVYTTRRTYA